MDVSHFGLFDVTGRSPSRTEPTPDQPSGPGRIANDNNRGAGARRVPRPRRLLLRFIPRLLRDPGPA
jgi:hypothetical protein